MIQCISSIERLLVLYTSGISFDSLRSLKMNSPARSSSRRGYDLEGTGGEYALLEAQQFQRPLRQAHKERSSYSRRRKQLWAVLLMKVWDVDALKCPKCGGQMKVIYFIESPVHIYRQRSLTGGFSGGMVSFRDHPGTTSFWHAGFRQESSPVASSKHLLHQNVSRNNKRS